MAAVEGGDGGDPGRAFLGVAGDILAPRGTPTKLGQDHGKQAGKPHGARPSSASTTALMAAW